MIHAEETVLEVGIPLIPFSVFSSLSLLWTIGVHLKDILIPHFKEVLQLNDLRTAWIQDAVVGGYCVAAFPARQIHGRHG